MTYINLPNVNDTDSWTAVDHNKLRDNFIASVPDIFTAKGDIAVGTGATTLVPVAGSDGEILTADSGEASGVKWASMNKIPVGGIIMWSGNIVNLPSWWQICDGTNGTPDLRNQFLVGAGDTYAVDATGGTITSSWSHTHSVSGATGADGAHTHTLTVSNESTHTHRYTSGNANTNRIVSSASGSSWASAANTTHYFDLVGVNHTHTNRNGATSDPGTHTHTVNSTSGSAGSASLDIRPSYYALAFIQRME